MAALTKKKMDLIYRLEGPAVDEGVDIFKLSPLLMSIGKMIQEGQEITHPGGHELGVNIKPFEKGSFVIELSVFAQTNLQQLLDVVNTDSVADVKELLEWLGLIAGTGGGVVGLIKLYKFLKGPPKKTEEVGANEIKITAKDDNSITVNKNTFALFQNVNIQQHINGIYGNFLGQEGVEKVSSYIKDDKETTQVVVEKEDVAYFNPANAIIEEASEDENRNITNVLLNAKRISLEGEPDNWSFRKGQREILKANIKDEGFLDKIKTGEIRLASGDLLEVTLVEIQTVDKNGQVHTKNEIIKVLNYKKGPSQTKLFAKDKEK